MQKDLKKAYLSALLDSTGDFIWSVDLDFRTVALNRAAAKAFEGLIGKSLSPGVELPPLLRKKLDVFYRRTIAEGAFETEYTFGDGRTRDLSFNPIVLDEAIRGISVFGREIKVSRNLGTLQDITELKLGEARLRDSEERFRATFEQAAIGILHVSFEGQILRCNARFAQFLGYSQEEIAGRLFREFTPPEYLTRSDEVLREFASGNIGESVWEKQYIHKSGSRVWGKLTTSIQRDGNGEPMHLISFVEDITARKSAEERLYAISRKLRESRLRYRTVLQTCFDSLNLSRLSDGRLVEVNKTFLDLTGREREEVIGKTTVELDIWANPSERSGIVGELRRNLSIRDVEVLFRRKSGQTFWALTSAMVIDIGGVPHVLVAAKDVSETKEAVRTVRQLAFYDPLTHLLNRRSLLDLLARAQSAHDRTRALLCVDLYSFSSFNDAFGHDVGDLLLQEAAQRITSCVLGTGAVARLGGDEFAILLENLSPVSTEAAEQARQMATAILAAGSPQYVLAEHECNCSLNIGITLIKGSLESGIEALRQGEIAMSQAKEEGRNTIRFFSPELQANVNARVQIEVELRKAIKAEEFELYFQPQMRGSQLIGSEALIRWKHPQRGFLEPGAFMSIAEETGLILPVSDWVLSKACEHIARWSGRTKSSNPPVAVNISAGYFSQPDFVKRVLAILDSFGVEPSSLKLELTESSLMKDLQDTVAKMTELKSHGLRFSIDDFGTGYSSLAYLKNLPLDQLKIDRAFVKDILVDAPSAVIAQAIISLGHSMGLSVIAEGIETVEQRDFLLGLGCDSFQGFLYGRPAPANEFERTWLR
jgi:diguanylate cyclase (GGDEF)-like protein/PAS domain S-box-containing protein